MKLQSLSTLFCISVILCSCSSKQVNDSQTIQNRTDANSPKYLGQTLGNLQEIDFDINSDISENASFEQSIGNFEKAVENFDSTGDKLTSLREMADLSIASVESSIAEDSNTLGSINTKEEPEYFDEIQFKKEEKNYRVAIDLYKQILSVSEDDDYRINSYYNLAKAYDFVGETESSVKTLYKLLKEHPENKHIAEANFRLGEYYFNDQDYEYASEFFVNVLNDNSNTLYTNHARYKKAWCEYNLFELDTALDDFFLLYETMLDSKKSKSNTRLKEESARGISLTFFYKDGVNSIVDYFQRVGSKPYEADIYLDLGEFYIAKERFNDAATVYKNYITRNPESKDAPKFAQAQVDMFQKIGNISKILNAKKEFAKAFGQHSAYWKTFPDRRDGYHALLSKNLIDLAQYHHAEAQKSGQIKSYNQASLWYSEFLDIAKDADKETHAIRNQYAESLYAAKEFSTAIEQFQILAYKTNNYDQKDKVAYTALVAREDLINQSTSEANKKDLQLIKIQEQLKFAEVFTKHKELNVVLANAVQTSLQVQPLTQTITIAKQLKNSPSANAEQQLYALETMANANFDLNNYSQSEAEYSELINLSSITAQQKTVYNDRLARSIYRQAEKLKIKGELLSAAEKFLQVANLAPTEVTPVALFDAADLYQQKEQWAESINIFNRLREAYPTHALNDTVPIKLAIAYENTQSLSKAASEYERIALANINSNNALAHSAMYKAATYFEQERSFKESIRVLQRYIQLPELSVNQQAEGINKLAENNKTLANAAEYKRWLDELVMLHKNAGSASTERTAYLAADAGFKLAEPHFVRFKNAKITYPLKQSIGIKKDHMVGAISLYKDILETRVKKYNTAARHRIGNIYHIFAQDLIDSERPAGLSELELEQYEILLEDEALPLEDDAITFYKSNTELAREGVYDKWVRSSYKELANIIPAQYAKYEQTERFVRIVN